MENQQVFKLGQRVKYVHNTSEVKMRPGSTGQIIEVGDIPAKVFKDPKCSDIPLAYTVLPDDGGYGQIVYPSEIESV